MVEFAVTAKGYMPNLITVARMTVSSANIASE